MKTHLFYHKLIFGCFIATFAMTGFAQKADSIKPLKRNKTDPPALLHAPVRSKQTDTLHYISDDSLRKVYGKNIDRSEAFYDSLKTIAYKRKWTSILYNFAIKNNSESEGLENVISTKDLPFVSYKGKVINNIEIIRLKPFDTLQISTTRKFLSKAGNSLHILTRQSVVEKNLLVKKGEKLDPVVISDNERILRTLPFIDEANIQIVETSANSDSVDIIIITKDKFSYAFNPVIKSINKFSFKFWSVNFLGLGHKFENNLSYNSNRDPRLYYEEGKYEVANIAGSFTRGLLTYKRNDLGRKKYTVGINRDFIPPTFNNAYGSKLTYVTYPKLINTSDSTTQNLNISYSVIDAYYSWGFALSRKNMSVYHPPYLMISGRLINTSYYSRPYISADSNLGFRERTTVLGGISLVKNNYFITNYVYGFGKTEDIPYGFTVQINGGYEIGEYYNRPYTGIILAYGDFFNKFGYVSGKLSVGSYFKNSSFEQGLADLLLRFASPVSKIADGRLRNYLDINLTYGFNRLPGEIILLNDKYGMKGLSNNDLTGQKRFITGWESVYYTPWYIYGFATAIYAFADFGILAGKDQSFIRSKVYTGVGLGVRIRNENLVFNTLQLQVTYFPRPPAGADNLEFSSSGIPELQLDGFYTTAPVIPSFY